MNEITISINPEKKWTRRTTFCQTSQYLSIYKIDKQTNEK